MQTSESGTGIARATRDDIEDLVRMFGNLHRFNASLDDRFELAKNWEVVLREQLDETCGQDDTAIWLARASETPAGFLMVKDQQGSPLYAHQHWVEITAIYVEKEFRGTGISHQLIDQANTWALDRDVDDIRLYVTANNDRARNFYESAQFEHIQEIWSRAVVPSD